MSAGDYTGKPLTSQEDREGFFEWLSKTRCIIGGAGGLRHFKVRIYDFRQQRGTLPLALKAFLDSVAQYCPRKRKFFLLSLRKSD